ncbi:MAG: hypothetical protein RIT81_34985 [Deltaproteobacteria bacterium]
MNRLIITMTLTCVAACGEQTQGSFGVIRSLAEIPIEKPDKLRCVSPDELDPCKTYFLFHALPANADFPIEVEFHLEGYEVMTSTHETWCDDVPGCNVAVHAFTIPGDHPRPYLTMRIEAEYDERSCLIQLTETATKGACP